MVILIDTNIVLDIIQGSTTRWVYRNYGKK